MEKWKKHYYLGIFSIFIGIISFVLLFVVFLILNPTYKHDYILRSFTMILPLIIGVIEIRDAFKYKKGSLVNEVGP